MGSKVYIQKSFDGWNEKNSKRKSKIQQPLFKKKKETFKNWIMLGMCHETQTSILFSVDNDNTLKFFIGQKDEVISKYFYSWVH